MDAAKERPADNPLGTERIGRLMLKFSVPAIVSFLVNAIYNIVDQIFIGQGIGTLGMAATNVAFPLNTIATALALLFGIGGASNFNLSQGRGEAEKAGRIAGNALSLGVLCGLGLMAVSLALLRPLLSAFGATEQVMPYAVSYTWIIAVGIPFQIFSTCAGNLIRADGSPAYSMVCMLAGAVFNVIFDPVFLFVFGMGIEGIALATTLGMMLSSGMALFYLLRRWRSVPMKRADFRPRLDMARVICSLGAASCFNQLAMTAVQVTMNNVLRHYGAASVYGSEIPLACVGAISKLNIIFMAFVIGIAQGCQPINGYNYGAKKYDRVKRTYKAAVLFATACACVAFGCFQLFPRQIMGIFGSGSEEYFRFAERYLRIYMLFTFLNGIQPVTSNFFTAIGKANMGFWMSLTRQVLILLPLLVLLPMWLGIDGVTYAGPIADGCAAVLAIVFVWREIRNMTRLERLEGQA